MVWGAYVEAAHDAGDEENWVNALGGSDNAPVTLRSGRPNRPGGGGDVRLDKRFLRVAYETLPKAVDPRTKASANVCLRFLCHPVLGPGGKPCGKTACSTDPKHPLHRPGERVCSRLHASEASLVTPLEPQHAALGLMYGGLIGYPRPPTGKKLQARSTVGIAAKCPRIT